MNGFTANKQPPAPINWDPQSVVVDGRTFTPPAPEAPKPPDPVMQQLVEGRRQITQQAEELKAAKVMIGSVLEKLDRTQNPPPQAPAAPRQASNGKMPGSWEEFRTQLDNKGGTSVAQDPNAVSLDQAGLESLVTRLADQRINQYIGQARGAEETAAQLVQDFQTRHADIAHLQADVADFYNISNPALPMQQRYEQAVQMVRRKVQEGRLPSAPPQTASNPWAMPTNPQAAWGATARMPQGGMQNQQGNNPWSAHRAPTVEFNDAFQQSELQNWAQERVALQRSKVR